MRCPRRSRPGPHAMTPRDEADIEAVVRALRDESEGDTHSDAVAAIAALRERGWQRVPDGWTLVPSVPEGWMPMVHTWQDCMDFDAHMLNRLSVQEPTHRALLFQRVAGKLEELAMLRASSAAAPEPPA